MLPRDGDKIRQKCLYLNARHKRRIDFQYLNLYKVLDRYIRYEYIYSNYNTHSFVRVSNIVWTGLYNNN